MDLRKLKQTLKYDCLSRIVPLAPTALQFPVTDKCNSKCVMCNVWKQKPQKEFTPEELEKILSDRLFKNINSVGINGGEPFLRKDLAGIIDVIAEKLPECKHITVLTNAINYEKNLPVILEINTRLAENKINFSIGVSLDGIGEVHDKIRGVPGNFRAAEGLVDALLGHNVNAWCGYTITPENAYRVDDALEWMKEKGLKYSEFRIANDINRIYNRGYFENNPYSDEKKLHLAQFFKKLAFDGDYKWINSPDVNRDIYLYFSGERHKRTTGCAWQHSGITLDARGGLSYCSVKSPVLGSCLDNSAYELYIKNIGLRREIRKNECPGCIHQLRGPLPLKTLLGQKVEKAGAKIRQKKLREKYKKLVIKPGKPVSIPPENWKKVLILGWWGTETLGDKAILAELLDFILHRSPNCNIAVSSYEDMVVKQTFRELNRSQPEIVPISQCFNKKLVSSVDAVIIGGGPLMGIMELNYILDAFIEADKQEKERVIFGCGINPGLSPRYEKIVKGLCNLATRGFFRDEESFQIARDYGIREENFGFSTDPAVAFVSKWQKDKTKDRSRIVTLLRENTGEYVKNRNELKKHNARLAESVAKALEGRNADLLAMHNLYLGNDDRIFNRKIYSKISDNENIYLEREYLTFYRMLERINNAKYITAMRYHGHLFALAMEIPFLSIDYSSANGKVDNLIRRLNLENCRVEWNRAEPGIILEKMRLIEQNYDEIRTALREKKRELLDEYNNVIKKVFK